MAQINFDASKVAPAKAAVCLPAGWYDAMITASSVVPTSAGTGTLLKLTYDILTGPHKGRKVFGQLNIKNPNQIAQEIGLSQLSAICGALGIIQLPDTNLLHNKPMKIKLKVKPGGIKDQSTGERYEDSNEVNGWENSKAEVGQTAAPVSAAPAPSVPAPAPAPAAQSWQAPAGQAWKPPVAAAPAPVQEQAAPVEQATQADPSKAAPPWEQVNLLT